MVSSVCIWSRSRQKMSGRVLVYQFRFIFITVEGFSPRGIYVSEIFLFPFILSQSLVSVTEIFYLWYQSFSLFSISQVLFYIFPIAPLLGQLQERGYYTFSLSIDWLIESKYLISILKKTNGQDEELLQGKGKREGTGFFELATVSTQASNLVIQLRESTRKVFHLF